MAYDNVNRHILFQKPRNNGICRKLYKSLMTIYDKLKCTLRINGKLTDWFSVGCSLKQGCSLSSILFNLYIDDLSEQEGIEFSILSRKLSPETFENVSET